ncbi:hypothetical protein C6V08_00415 [Burkholderia gladioli]|nr:hypothetical protein C6V08_00415 [Burkholderia gladioli]
MDAAGRGDARSSPPRWRAGNDARAALHRAGRRTRRHDRHVSVGQSGRPCVGHGNDRHLERRAGIVGLLSGPPGHRRSAARSWRRPTECRRQPCLMILSTYVIASG